jgi:two-component system phosphate regulon sensor histidine kinase PhoR
MDEELKVVASQIGHAIDVTGDKPTFRDWLRVVETEPARSVMSMQLFDPDGNLLEHYGPPGIPRLLEGQEEMTENQQTVRIRQSKLTHKGNLVGYLQLQLPADKRSELTREFLATMAIMAPFVLFGFGICSYIVSGIAARPIEHLFVTLQRFVADAGHELNTPASIIQARSQSLERKLTKQGIVVDDVPVITSASERMGQIVRNLMLLAELDSGSQEPVRTTLDLQEIINCTLAEFLPRFQEKKIALKSSLQPITVFTDRESIDCILRNLVGNALKYTETGGAITVTCVTHEGEVCLTVEDTGIGIPEDSLPLIFERFYRVDKSRSRASGGSGLGLAIVKAVTESLSGRVEVESELAKGTRFYVYLPLPRASAVAQKLHTCL